MVTQESVHFCLMGDLEYEMMPESDLRQAQMLNKEQYLKELKNSISEYISDYSLEVLSNDRIPIEELANTIEESILESLSEQYSYFKTQYERAEYLLNYFSEMKKEISFTGTLQVEQDSITGDLCITFPEEVLKTTGWTSSDTLEWIRQTDGSYLLRKAEIW